MPRHAEALDDLLARLERASAALDDLALASSLESALVRAGRLEEAYLLRWRRGEPSPVAAAIAERQRPVLAALAADPALQPVPCPVCGPNGCGPARSLLVAAGQDDGTTMWTALAADAPLPEAPIVGARRIRRVEDLEALRDVSSIVELGVWSSALRPGAPLPSSTQVLGLHVLEHAALEPGLLVEALGALPGLRELSLGGRVTNETVEDVLLESGGSLERLGLDGGLLTDVGLEALRRAPRLRELSLDEAPWFDGSCLGALVDAGAPLERFVLHGAPRSTWRTFAALGELPKLRTLDLYRVDLEQGADDLAALPELRELALAWCALEVDTSVELLAGWPLERVTLENVPGADVVLETLAASPSLRRLSLQHLSDVTAAGWSALSHAPALERLSIERCALDTEGCVALSRSSSIRELTLNGVEGVHVAAVFGAVARMDRLEALVIDGEQACPAAVLSLTTGARRLQTLELRVARGASEVGELLAATARLPALEHLSLASLVAPGAIARLAGAPTLRSLKLANRGSLDDEEVAALRECFWLERLELPCDELTLERLQERLPEVDVRSSFVA